jgi:chromosome segregation ATPase
MDRASKSEDRGSRIEEDTRFQTSVVDPKSSIIDSPTPTASWTIGLDQELREFLSTLDALVYRLIDEQLRVVKQCQQLAEARAQWEKERHARAKDLESRNLQLRKDERVLEERMEKLRQRDMETNQTRQSLETWQARITLETASWKAERERLLAQVHSLEVQADRLSAIIGELPADWQDRLRQGHSTLIQKHRQAKAEAEYARLRQELRTLQDQGASYERQIADLTALVDRLAALLIEDESTSSLPAARAA